MQNYNIGGQIDENRNRVNDDNYQVQQIIDTNNFGGENGDGNRAEDEEEQDDLEEEEVQALRWTDEMDKIIIDNYALFK